ncbi:MAG: L-aspartate oxidase [Desulfobacterales bacterium]|nr:L-aspartate oxidase [Desulfobacterales bacterium]
MPDFLETDVLIIGSGIAGGIAAFRLARSGLNVILTSRSSNVRESNTLYAQGGIIYKAENDSRQLLTKDIQNAGAEVCNPEHVGILAAEGPELVEKILIQKLNVPFDRTETGALALTMEGGHSVPRILHHADSTGKAIQESLIRKVQKYPNIKMLTDHTAIDLLTLSHHSLNSRDVYKPQTCVGAYLLDQKNNEIIPCIARKVVLATGGLGQIFLRTTNPKGARGDGLAMAYRAGARVINNEFIQFHPTTFYHKDAACFLISEAVRGEGARLVHADGKPFMDKYDRGWKDLAPRDLVSRSIHTEIIENDLTCVYLDLCSYIPRDKILSHFPTIYKNCLAYGIDITKDLVPVVPAAHYSCGGIWVDQWGRSTINNLYAIGEVACTGVHGANRLASSSLLEGVVWGDRSARNILKDIGQEDLFPQKNIPQWQLTGTASPDPALITQDMNSIKHVMWNYVGLVRTNHRLRRAIRDLRGLEIEIENFYRAVHLNDNLIGLRNAVRAAIIVALAAWENTKSIGCHFREQPIIK